MVWSRKEDKETKGKKNFFFGCTAQHVESNRTPCIAGAWNLNHWMSKPLKQNFHVILFLAAYILKYPVPKEVSKPKRETLKIKTLIPFLPGTGK